MKSYPPLKAILAFHSAMEYMSFTIAAEAMAVTPSAISQQIHKLEEWLGVSLFVREVRQVRATSKAQEYWSSIRPALTQIQKASQSMRERETQAVRLSLPPTLAAKWFAPRMASFIGQHPEISLHLIAASDLADFDNEDVDLAIRYFNGNDSSLEKTLLLPDEARVFCSPDYAQRLKLRTCNDLQNATLLHTTLHPLWSLWLSMFSDLTKAQSERIQSLYFNQTLLSIEAARYSRGVVLCSRHLVESELQNGSLIAPFDCALPVDKAYYVVYPREVKLRTSVQMCKNWLLSLAS